MIGERGVRDHTLDLGHMTGKAVLSWADWTGWRVWGIAQVEFSKLINDCMSVCCLDPGMASQASCFVVRWLSHGITMWIVTGDTIKFAVTLGIAAAPSQCRP